MGPSLRGVSERHLRQVRNNGLEFELERHMLKVSFPVILYGISCDAPATTSSNN
jgi:hypothetical protein